MLNFKKKNHEPLLHITRRNDLLWWQRLIIRLGSILIGLILICLITLMLTGANPFLVLGELFRGNFGSSRKFWVSFRSMMLLLGVALALVPAFKMKFWNLGGNGQILMGGLIAVCCMLFMGNAGCPDWAIILVMIPCSILAGAAWAVIPAVFKAFFNTNESLFTLMMNYIASGLVAIFITAVVANGSGSLPIIETGQLSKIGGKDYLLSILVIAAVLVLMYIYLQYSKHGFELSVVGSSPNTARYIGINVKKVMIRTLCLSGAICGLVGMLLTAGIDHTINETSDQNMGFTAIMVAWLAHFDPLAMVGTSFLITFLNRGMASVQTTYGLTSDAASSIMLGLMYFIIIAAEFFITYKVHFKKHDSASSKDLVIETNDMKKKEDK